MLPSRDSGTHIRLADKPQLPVFSRRLREAREAYGVSQRSLGIEAGLDDFVASTRINRYETGVHQPDLQTLQRLAAVLGLPVAYSQFNSTFKDGAYSVKGAFSAAGLARIFDDTKGSISSSGRIVGDTVRPARFHSDYTSGRKASTIDVRFAGGDVVSTEVTPPPKRRGSDWVAIRPGDLKDVADPLTVTMVSADSLDKVCNRKVKLYDSEMRADLTLSYVTSGSISVKGYEGPTVTCQLRFNPVSGYRKGRKAIEFVRTKSRIMVTFAPVGQTGVYAPVRATVGTEIGTITIQARRFEATE